MDKQSEIKMIKGDQELLKKTNLWTVLEKIRNDGPISRAGIAKITGLSRSTCSILADELLSEGLIIELGKDTSSGGRKPILLQMNYDGLFAIGIKVMQGSIISGLVDLGGNIRGIHTQTLTPNPGKQELTSDLVSAAEAVRASLGAEDRLVGIGIGVGGKIDHRNGILLESSILDLQNVNLTVDLNQHFDVPVYLENDVNAFTLGEKFFGSGAAYSNFICVSMGDGIGAGLYLNDELYRGSHHIAGEFGHIRITDEQDALRCSCGKRGCLEAYTSSRAIMEKYSESAGKSASTGGIPQLIDLFDEKDKAAVDTFTTAGRYLGEGLAMLVNIFDPSAVIIGGEGMNYFRCMEEEIRRSLKENTVYGLSDEIDLIPVLSDDNLWIRGISSLVFRELFSLSNM